MSNIDDFYFTTAEAGASNTILMEAGQIRKGGMIMIKVNLVKFLKYQLQKLVNMIMQNVIL